MFDTTPTLDCAGRALKLHGPRICGILTLTGDSFSGDGLRDDAKAAVGRGLEMAEEGADLLDVGAESTRSGAQPVSVEDEIARVVPVIEALVCETDVPISADTSKPEAVRAAAAAGAGMINDVYALRREGALAAAAELHVPVCVMHMQGEPRTMQDNPHYEAHGTAPSGKPFTSAFVVTCVWQRLPEGWRIVYGHESWAKPPGRDAGACARPRGWAYPASGCP